MWSRTGDKSPGYYHMSLRDAFWPVLAQRARRIAKEQLELMLRAIYLHFGSMNSEGPAALKPSVPCTL